MSRNNIEIFGVASEAKTRIVEESFISHLEGARDLPAHVRNQAISEVRSHGIGAGSVVLDEYRSRGQRASEPESSEPLLSPAAVDALKRAEEIIAEDAEEKRRDRARQVEADAQETLRGVYDSVRFLEVDPASWIDAESLASIRAQLAEANGKELLWEATYSRESPPKAGNIRLLGIGTTTKVRPNVAEISADAKFIIHSHPTPEPPLPSFRDAIGRLRGKKIEIILNVDGTLGCMVEP